MEARRDKEITSLHPHYNPLAGKERDEFVKQIYPTTRL